MNKEPGEKEQHDPDARLAAESDALKDRDLLRIKRLATALLLFVIIAYAAAAMLAPHYPPLAYVAATCEAATVGALADWFAVVALFRHPLNIPLPHTAIIQKNKARIARGLGEFIQQQFLSTPALVAKIREIDPAERLATWLLRPENAATLATYATRLLSYTLGALEDARVREFLRRSVTARLHEADIAALAGQVLDVLTQNQRHHALLEQALAGAHEFLSRDQTRQYLASELSREWPLVRWLTESLHLDRIAAERILDFAIARLAEFRDDPEHEFRKKFDLIVQRFIARLKTDPALRAKVDQLRDDVLGNAATEEYLGGLWSDLRESIDADLRQDASAIRGEVTELMRSLGARLDADAGVKHWINEQILAALPQLVAEHRAGAGRFIERQVNNWHNEKLVQELERNIGADLQYVRINGTLVGGAAGLLIFTATRFALG